VVIFGGLGYTVSASRMRSEVSLRGLRVSLVWGSAESDLSFQRRYNKNSCTSVA
jgi:hypothetical protein